TALGMPDMNWYRDWQKFHLFRTLYSSAEQPFLSFHDSRDGQPLLPTPFLDAEVVPAPASRTIHSERELQLLQGRMSGKSFAEITRKVNFENDGQARRFLQQRFGPNYNFPITGLEAYRRCPFRYYVERVLKLSPLPEPEFAVDARQWGTIVHDVLSLLYQNGPVPLSQLAEAAGRALQTVLARVDLPVFWQQVTRRVFDNLLPRFAEREAELRKAGFSPARIESKLQGRVTDDILVQGRLDRIDESASACRILDYKTGTTAGISATAVLENRTHIQLPLYAYLLSQVSGFRSKRVENVGIYSLQDIRVYWLADKVPLQQLIEAAIQTTVQTVQAIRAGYFPADPAPKQLCRSCPLSFTCGHQQHQTST
ncbi:MAG: PD-(D/E)XK nuclease family protein, partial [candidate division WOR-3 bacterium]